MREHGKRRKSALYKVFSSSSTFAFFKWIGELVGNLSDCGNSCLPDDDLKDTAAETFLRDGLSKVMKKQIYAIMTILLTAVYQVKSFQ